MLYAHVTGGTVQQVGPLPRLWYDGIRWWDFRDDAHDPAALGWLPVTIEPRPDDTETTTWDRNEPAIVAGVPVIGWTERDKTLEELQADAEQSNAETISNRFLDTDLPAMLDIIDQTNADLRADPAQEIKAIARAIRRIIRKTDAILDAAD